mgnify:FL=1
MKEIDCNKGNSVIIIRSQTGKKIIEDMRVKNFIVAQKSNIDELLKGQSISLRRLNVSCYSTALKAILAKLDSYLYNQQDISSLPKKQIKKAEKEIIQFIEFEKQSPQKVIMLAKRKIYFAKKREQFKKLPIIKILKKIKSLIQK